MKILYIGSKSGTSGQRAGALTRLGHKILHFDPASQLPARWATWLHYQGGTGIDQLVSRAIRRAIPAEGAFDLVHVDGGSLIGPRAIEVLRTFGPRISSFNADNPFLDPSPELRRWKIMRRALPLYDVVVTIRRPGVESLMRHHGVRRPITVWQSADEVIHSPTQDVAPKWQSDVCFVGTWMPGREKFMEAMIAAGLNLALYGPRWDRSPNFNMLRPNIRAGYLEGRDYARAIGGARIGLVILNHRNQDLHTNRSIEMPSIGTAICAQRTSYHEELFEEGREALFFEDPIEAAQKCLSLLADPQHLDQIASAGQQKVRKLRLGNEDLMRSIITSAVV
ncbi:CgeB family protein [Paracoccus benzoatiresistens]|uniref:Glycosyltransferase n=1 Tax=Paracoccus benzoatiresistens TaxID=2997341 RepID=A0ABT4J9B9_9RHOB|nr:glycosyltransferase [Paracoccus sp. EF6]MCZ0963685.1 glycosyltransferase [Paracoccus sp. EF6]